MKHYAAIFCTLLFFSAEVIASTSANQAAPAQPQRRRHNPYIPVLASPDITTTDPETAHKKNPLAHAANIKANLLTDGTSITQDIPGGTTSIVMKMGIDLSQSAKYYKDQLATLGKNRDPRQANSLIEDYKNIIEAIQQTKILRSAEEQAAWDTQEAYAWLGLSNVYGINRNNAGKFDSALQAYYLYEALGDLHKMGSCLCGMIAANYYIEQEESRIEKLIELLDEKYQADNELKKLKNAINSVQPLNNYYAISEYVRTIKKKRIKSF